MPTELERVEQRLEEIVQQLREMERQLQLLLGRVGTSQQYQRPGHGWSSRDE